MDIGDDGSVAPVAQPEVDYDSGTTDIMRQYRNERDHLERILVEHTGYDSKTRDTCAKLESILTPVLDHVRSELRVPIASVWTADDLSTLIGDDGAVIKNLNPKNDDAEIEQALTRLRVRALVTILQIAFKPSIDISKARMQNRDLIERLQSRQSLSDEDYTSKSDEMRMVLLHEELAFTKRLRPMRNQFREQQEEAVKAAADSHKAIMTLIETQDEEDTKHEFQNDHQALVVHMGKLMHTSFSTADIKSVNNIAFRKNMSRVMFLSVSLVAEAIAQTLYSFMTQ